MSGAFDELHVCCPNNNLNTLRYHLPSRGTPHHKNSGTMSNATTAGEQLHELRLHLMTLFQAESIEPSTERKRQAGTANYKTAHLFT